MAELQELDVLGQKGERGRGNRRQGKIFRLLFTSWRWISAVRLGEKETYVPLVHIHGGLVVVVADEVHAASPDLVDGDERDGQE